MAADFPISPEELDRLLDRLLVLLESRVESDDEASSCLYSLLSRALSISERDDAEVSGLGYVEGSLLRLFLFESSSGRVIIDEHVDVLGDTKSVVRFCETVSSVLTRIRTMRNRRNIVEALSAASALRAVVHAYPLGVEEVERVLEGHGRLVSRWRRLLGLSYPSDSHRSLMYLGGLMIAKALGKPAGISVTPDDLDVPSTANVDAVFFACSTSNMVVRSCVVVLGDGAFAEAEIGVHNRGAYTDLDVFYVEMYPGAVPFITAVNRGRRLVDTAKSIMSRIRMYEERVASLARRIATVEGLVSSVEKTYRELLSDV